MTLSKAIGQEEISVLPMIFDQLEDLRMRAPKSHVVREQLAVALLWTAVEHADRPVREVMTEVEELVDSIDDLESRRIVSRSLLLAIFRTVDRDLQDVRDALSEMMRRFAERDSDDPEIQDLLGKVLSHCLLRDENKEVEERLSVVRELRDLAARYPEEVEAQERMATALFIEMAWRRQEDDASAQQCLEDLRALALAHPDNLSIHHSLAWGLLETMKALGAEPGDDRRASLLGEMRQIVDRFPEEESLKDLLQRVGS